MTAHTYTSHLGAELNEDTSTSSQDASIEVNIPASVVFEVPNQD